MPPNQDDKTEQATPRRRQDEREKGRVAKSADLNAAAILLAGMLLLRVFGPFMNDGLSAFLVTFLGDMQAEFPFLSDVVVESAGLTVEDVDAWTGPILLYVFKYTAPVLIGLALMAAIVNLCQIGFLMSSDPLIPKFSKLNPLSGIQNLFSMRSVMRLVASLTKIAIVGIVIYFTVMGYTDDFVLLMHRDKYQIFRFTAEVTFDVGLKAAIALLLIAIIDYTYQRFQYGKDMMMSKQEIKDELKEQEGDPHIKGRRMSIMRQLAQQRMMAAVPKADVVVTNPEHYAVAVEYDPDKMRAPVVVAKGMNEIALRIRKIAAENGIPIYEDKPLAQTLYKTVKIGREIPEKLYKTIAEILASIYRTSRSKAAKLTAGTR